MKGYFKHIAVICFSVPVVLGCVKPFEPEIERYENIYVVDGELNNLPGPYEVKVYRSKKYGTDSAQVVNNAVVTIADDQNNQVVLTEIKAGTYSTTNSGFRGIPGRRYKLRIEIEQDTVLESEYIEMHQPVEIEKVYWEFEDRLSYAGISGLQMYLDAQPSASNANYYIWEYEEYWKFESPFKNQDAPNEKYCWDSSMIHPLILGSTAGLSQNRLQQKKLYFVSNETARLSLRYSTLIKQYVINEKAYLFYKDLQKLNETSGSLFDPIPFSLEGNMHQLDDPDAPVLGLFLVSSVTSKRIFINQDEYPNILSPAELAKSCEKKEVPITDSIQIAFLMNNSFIPYDTIINPLGLPPSVLLASKHECYDCTTIGTNKKPAFWKD